MQHTNGIFGLHNKSSLFSASSRVNGEKLRNTHPHIQAPYLHSDLSFHISDLPRYLVIVDKILAFFYTSHNNPIISLTANTVGTRQPADTHKTLSAFARAGRHSNGQTCIAPSDSLYHLVLQFPFSTKLVEEKCFNVQHEDHLFQYAEAALVLHLTFGWSRLSHRFLTFVFVLRSCSLPYCKQ